MIGQCQDLAASHWRRARPPLRPGPRVLQPGTLRRQSGTTATIHPGELPGALCPQTDPEIFFPEAGGSPKAAKRVCAACEVRPECLAMALSLGPVMGVWGGLTERERAALKRAARVPSPVRRICPGCKKEFTKPTSHAIYCSDLCRQKARRATKVASAARRTHTSPRRAA